MLDPKRAQNWVTRKLSPARQNTFGGLLPPQQDRLNVPGTSDSSKNRSNSDTKIKPLLEPDEQLPASVSPNIARKTKEALRNRAAEGEAGSSPSIKNSWFEKLRQKSIDIPASFRFVAQSSGSSSDSPKLVQQDSLEIPEITLDPPSSSASQPVQLHDMPLSSMKGPFSQLPMKLRKPGEPLHVSQWKPVTANSGKDVTGLWVRADGKELRLTGLQLDSLGRNERFALQKVAVQRLQRANLGCNIVRPKGKHFLKLLWHKNHLDIMYSSCSSVRNLLIVCGCFFKTSRQLFITSKLRQIAFIAG